MHSLGAVNTFSLNSTINLRSILRPVSSAAVIKRVDFRLPARWYGGSRAALLEVNGVEIEAITRRTPQVSLHLHSKPFPVQIMPDFSSAWQLFWKTLHKTA